LNVAPICNPLSPYNDITQKLHFDTKSLLTIAVFFGEPSYMGDLPNLQLQVLSSCLQQNLDGPFEENAAAFAPCRLEF